MVKKVLMAVVIVGATPLMADTEYVNGYTWTYRIEGDTAVISDVYNEHWERYAVISPKPVGAVTIPSTLGGKPVTSIESFNDGENLGFDYFDGLTSLTIPASVKTISDCAFIACQSVTSLTAPTWCKNAKYSDRDRREIAAEGDDELSENEFLVMIFGCGCTSFYDSCVRHASQIKVTYKDVGGSEQGGGAVSDIWKKARTLQGALMDNMSGSARGIIQVKVGKMNRKGQVLISGTIIGLDGKKLTARGGKVTVGGATVSTTLKVKNNTLATVTVDVGGMAGSWNGCRIARADIGGELNKTGFFDVSDAPYDAPYELVDGLYAQIRVPNSTSAWPEYEPVAMNGRTWSCRAAARMKWIASNCYGDACLACPCSWGWVVVGGGPNYSGLRLKYNKANGTFKGSFNLYLRDERRGSNKAKGLKKRFNVTGVVVNGIGYGVANSRDIGSFNVRIW